MMCREASEPIYVTKKGYGEMVIMSVKMYEERLYMADVYSKLAAAEEQTRTGTVLDAEDSLQRIREKYHV
jgi:PHD/YefM family antitoxin component YafN of YafNO toxin-antitoxin module